jgi:predicted RNA-binding Zn-ribbon protein involved in translation (DUF1610 family)
MENTLIRSEPCGNCGADMLWTQNAWKAEGTGTSNAAYRCLNGHVLDPSTTRQCPVCGVHDTRVVEEVDGRQEFRCARCGHAFGVPR